MNERQQMNAAETSSTSVQSEEQNEDLSRRAVERMENAAASARSRLNRAETDRLNHARLIPLPGEVLTASAWGAANASSDLSNAIESAAEYARAIEALAPNRGDSQ